MGASARGKGVGTKLLAWVESTARARGAKTLSLAVVRGNPAKRLYERVGYVVRPVGACEEALSCLVVTVFFGRPYGFCHPAWGSDMMYKEL